MSGLPLWALIVICTTGAIWLTTALFIKKGERLQFLLVLLGIAAIGATAGILGGLSRDGAVGEIMAAALGLLGGLVVWLFAADRSNGSVVSLCALAFAISLFSGYIEGSSRRAEPERYLYWRVQCADSFSDPEKVGDPLTFQVMSDSFGTICANIFKYEKDVLLK
jgi:hypothetical protein